MYSNYKRSWQGPSVPTVSHPTVQVYRSWKDYTSSYSGEDFYRLRQHYKKILTFVIILSVVIITIIVTAMILMGIFMRKHGNSDTASSAATLNFPGTATIDGTFTDAMKDTDSDAFKEVETAFCQRVDMMMKNSPLSDIYIRCQVHQIRSGSLILDYTIKCLATNNDDISDIHDDLTNSMQTNSNVLRAQVTLDPVNVARITYGEDSCASSPCTNGAICIDLPFDYICMRPVALGGSTAVSSSVCPEVTTDITTCAPCPEYTTTGPMCPDVTTYAPCPELTTGVTTCAPCPELTTDVTTCTPCPESTTGVTTCVPCPDVTTPEQVTPCPTFQPTPNHCADDPCQNGAVCINTTDTYYCDCPINWTGQNCSTALCGTGYQINGSECDECPVGTYKPTEGNTNCTSCPEGSTTDSAGTVVPEQCHLCIAGYTKQCGTGDCEPCAAGTYKNVTGNLPCSPCPAGTYSNVTAPTECSACPNGTYAKDAVECRECSGEVINNGTACETSTGACGARRRKRMAVKMSAELGSNSLESEEKDTNSRERVKRRAASLETSGSTGNDNSPETSGSTATQSKQTDSVSAKSTEVEPDDDC